MNRLENRRIAGLTPFGLQSWFGISSSNGGILSVNTVELGLELQ
jgi:hypothetical protein